jgi:hypothetical protein
LHGRADGVDHEGLLQRLCLEGSHRLFRLKAAAMKASGRNDHQIEAAFRGDQRCRPVDRPIILEVKCEGPGPGRAGGGRGSRSGVDKGATVIRFQQPDQGAANAAGRAEDGGAITIRKGGERHAPCTPRSGCGFGGARNNFPTGKPAVRTAETG